MDSRTDLQLLLENMDRAIESKRKELSELDQRLQVSRRELSAREARELQQDARNLEASGANKDDGKSRSLNGQDSSIVQLYEQQLKKFADELAELEAITQELGAENESLRAELLKSQANGDSLTKANNQLKSQLDECQTANLELSLKLGRAEDELNLQQRLLVKSHREDQVLMDAFSDKLESLKATIKSQEEEINSLRQDNHFILDSIGLLSNDKRDEEDGGPLMVSGDNELATHFGGSKLNDDSPSDSIKADERLTDQGRKLMNIICAFKDKERQITLLKGQSMRFNKDLKLRATSSDRNSHNSNNSIANSRFFKMEADSSNEFGGRDDYKLSVGDQSADYDNDEVGGGRRKGNGSVVVSWDTNQQANNADDSAPDEPLKARCRMLERELDDKDRLVSLMAFQIHHFETILPKKISYLLNELIVILEQHKQSTVLADDRLPQANNDTVSTTSDGASVVSIIMKKQLDDKEQDYEQKQDDDKILIMNREPNRSNNSGKFTEKLSQLIGLLGQTLDRRQQISDMIYKMGELERIIQARDLKIKSLVRELNCMSAKLNLVQQLCDLLRSQASKIEISAVESELANLNDNLAANEESKDRENELDASKSLQSTIGHELEPLVGTESKVQSPSSSSERQNMVEKDEMKVTSKEQEVQCDLEPSSLTKTNASSDPRERDNLIAKEQRTPNDVDGEPSIKTRSVDGLPTAKASEPKTLMGSLVVSEKHAQPQQELDRNLRRLVQLEADNELLELAMKEILLALRSCDSRCANILIESPSLERLCQLIEARHLSAAAEQPVQSSSGHMSPSGGSELAIYQQDPQLNQQLLFQLIVLKSELDILRGQNEQLRVELKGVKREQAIQLVSSRQSLVETEIQTDESRLIDAIQDGACESMTKERANQSTCANCLRLSRLTGHLSQSIVRIETRVSMSDESYMSKMISLQKLNETLEHELANRERLVSGLQRECHLLSQQKLLLEAKLQFLEAHHQLPKTTNGSKLEVYTRMQAHNGTQSSNSIQSLTIQRDTGTSLPSTSNLPNDSLRNSKLTIQLLQSIMNCLQSRLSYKDERLRQLENLLAEQQTL